MARYALAAATSGTKAIFAGGKDQFGYNYFVDIYDTATSQWDFDRLEIGRAYLTSINYGTTSLFVGGICCSDSPTDKVDIYTPDNGVQPFAALPNARYNMAVTSNDNKFYFAGGHGASSLSSRVDIFDSNINTWIQHTSTPLAQGRNFLGSASAGKYVAFAGGQSGIESATPLTVARSALSALSAGKYIAFAGGNQFGSGAVDVVDYMDTTTSVWATAKLSNARANMGAVAVGNKMIFGGGNNRGVSDALQDVDIFDVTDWSRTRVELPTAV